MSWSPESLHVFWCDASDCIEAWWSPIVSGSIAEARARAVVHGWTTDGARDYCPEHSKHDQPKETD